MVQAHISFLTHQILVEVLPQSATVDLVSSQNRRIFLQHYLQICVYLVAKHVLGFSQLQMFYLQVVHALKYVGLRNFRIDLEQADQYICVIHQAMVPTVSFRFNIYVYILIWFTYRLIFSTMLKHTLDNSTAIGMGSEIVYLPVKCVDDKLDVLSRNALNSLLNDVITILIFDTF